MYNFFKKNLIIIYINSWSKKNYMCFTHYYSILIKLYKINPTKIKVIHHGVKKKNF